VRTAGLSTAEFVVRVPETIDLGAHCPTGRTACL
jgi:hypothetical protein